MLTLNVVRRAMAFTATLYTVTIMLALAGNGSATGAAGHVTRTTTANVSSRCRFPGLRASLPRYPDYDRGHHAWQPFGRYRGRQWRQG